MFSITKLSPLPGIQSGILTPFPKMLRYQRRQPELTLPSGSSKSLELEPASRSLPPAQGQCPSNSCEAHWSRRSKVVREYRAGLGLCRACFLGRPLSTNPISAPPKADEFAKQEQMCLQAMAEKEIGVSAAARIIGCSPDSVLRLIEEGAVEAWRISPRGWYRVNASSLARYVNRTAKGHLDRH